jgi:hypothetical protein
MSPGTTRWDNDQTINGLFKTVCLSANFFTRLSINPSTENIPAPKTMMMTDVSR